MNKNKNHNSQVNEIIKRKIYFYKNTRFLNICIWLDKYSLLITFKRHLKTNLNILNKTFVKYKNGWTRLLKADQKTQVLENFMGYSNQIAEKKFFKPFWSYIDFGKVIKKRKNRNISRNIELHGLTVTKSFFTHQKELYTHNKKN